MISIFELFLIFLPSSSFNSFYKKPILDMTCHTKRFFSRRETRISPHYQSLYPLNSILPFPSSHISSQICDGFFFIVAIRRNSILSPNYRIFEVTFEVTLRFNVDCIHCIKKSRTEARKRSLRGMRFTNVNRFSGQILVKVVTKIRLDYTYIDIHVSNNTNIDIHECGK